MPAVPWFKEHTLRREVSILLVINLLGGPCTGKSVMASQVFVNLKKENVNTDLIAEFAREEIYSSSHRNLENQIFVFGHQQHRLWRLQGQVDVAITDSPLLLNICYSKTSNPLFGQFVYHEYLQYENLNYFLIRSPEFKFDAADKGRIHSLEQSVAIDKRLREILQEYKVDYSEILPGEEQRIVKDVLQRLEHRPH